MFRLRSISARLMLTILLILAVTCAVEGGFSVMQHRTLTRMALDQQLKLQYDSVTASIDYEGRAALAVSDVIAALPPVQDGIAKGDRAALMTLLGGAQKTLAAQGMPLITLITPPGTSFLRIHNPKTFGDDMSGRRNTVVVANQTGQSIVGIEPALNGSLTMFAMTPIMHDGKSLAVIDNGVPLGREFVDSAKRRYGVDLIVHAFVGNAFTTLSSTLGETKVATQDELQAAFNGTTVRRELTVDGHPAALYLGQIKNYAGQPVAVIELVKDTTAYEVAAARAQRHLILGTVAILIAGVFLALLLGRGVSRPLIAITATMNRLSSGDTAVTIPGSSRHDELGVMANAVQVFKDSMIETERLKLEQEVSRTRAEAERREGMLDLAARFETSIGGIVGNVASAASKLEATARTVAATSGETTQQAANVAATSVQATIGSEAVAAATEQLVVSIREISQQVTRSGGLIQEAVQQANQSDEQVRGLTEAADKIGDVVQLISDIASQTALLALNATIEAARAGDAGKGFAVVASEVKAPATQTASATGRIGVQIKAIQEATRSSARSIQSITETIGRVNQTAASISAAVEEQGVATQEIARNVTQSAQGTRDAPHNRGQPGRHRIWRRGGANAGRGRRVVKRRGAVAAPGQRIPARGARGLTWRAPSALPENLDLSCRKVPVNPHINAMDKAHDRASTASMPSSPPATEVKPRSRKAGRRRRRA